MPHMMPMMWIMIYLSTLLLLMIFISLLYFFFIPMPILSKFNKKSKNLSKWTWLW